MLAGGAITANNHGLLEQNTNLSPDTSSTTAAQATPSQEAPAAPVQTPSTEAQTQNTPQVNTSGIDTNTLWGKLYTRNGGDAQSANLASQALMREHATAILNSFGEVHLSQQEWRGFQRQLEGWGGYERSGNLAASSFEVFIASLPSADRDLMRVQYVLTQNPQLGIPYLGN